MAEPSNPIVEILVKYALYEPLSEEETRLLEAWRSRSEGHHALPDQMRDPKWIAGHKRLLKRSRSSLLSWTRAHSRASLRSLVPIVAVPVEHRIHWQKPVLALVIVLTVVGGWMWMRTPGPVAQVEAPPANFQALLTREDGQMLVLDTVPVGGVVLAGAGVARKTDDHTLTYEMDQGVRVQQRLTVGQGAGPFRIILADGSRVLLRAGASLDFCSDLRSGKPVLEGEAWFGIARDASRPLTVIAGGMEVRVLGTTFDVIAPAAGENKVSLFSGAVRVRKRNDSILLRPGQAAVAGARGLAERILTDSERMASWRGPYMDEESFVFENTSLREMLKELAAWYGVQVSNPYKIEGVGITGKLPRGLPLKQLLKALERGEMGHARLRMNVDTILVLPGKPGG